MISPLQKPKPLVLCVLDGWGMAPDGPANSIVRASPVNFNKLWFSYPHTLLKASGSAVGLPEGVVGNSEVGHLNLGAGRIVPQDVLRIDFSIKDRSFFQNEALKKSCQYIDANNSKIHLIGLVGPSSVHSKTSHLLALLQFYKEQNIAKSRVKIHVFTDGRDSSPTIAKSYISDLENQLNQNNLGSIVSICGRYYAMDRDNRWDRTEKAYRILTEKSENVASNVSEAIENSYSHGILDEFIEPVQIKSEEGDAGIIENGDAVIFFNYRPDRARQLTKAFVLENFKSVKTSSNVQTPVFNRRTKLSNLFFATMTRYEEDLPVSTVLFMPNQVNTPISRIFAERSEKQLHIAETEKYAHVTYFFNGGRETPFPGEERILVDSKKVTTYDQVPEMSAEEITKKLIPRISSRIYDFIIVNFANADMVSHTGNFEASVKAIQAVDTQIGLITKSIVAVGGALIITSDHGNAETMTSSQTGEVDTEHNTSPVPCIIISSQLKNHALQLTNGILADVAPTILGILKIPKPSQMTGRNLLD